VIDAVTLLEDDRTAIIGYSRERNMHLYATAATRNFDVAFLDAAGKIVECADFRRSSEAGVTATVPAMYALVLREGWLRDNSVKAGARAKLSASLSARQPEPLPAVKIGKHTVFVELARNHKERMRGLMHRPKLSPDDGMLFCYDYASDRSFWMHNCYTPLDIVFLKEDGSVINVVETPIWEDPLGRDGPRSESAEPAQYVLEVNFGWFRANGFLDESGAVNPGTRVEIPAGISGGP
jgi:uncharacterized membrane protein (UPF0127 family)